MGSRMRSYFEYKNDAANYAFTMACFFSMAGPFVLYWVGLVFYMMHLQRQNMLDNMATWPPILFYIFYTFRVLVF